MLPGTVAAGEIVAHFFDRQTADTFGRAQHALAKRMLAEVGGPALVVGPKRRLILVHLDFFENHLLLGLEILIA